MRKREITVKCRWGKSVKRETWEKIKRKCENDQLVRKQGKEKEKISEKGWLRKSDSGEMWRKIKEKK